MGTEGTQQGPCKASSTPQGLGNTLRVLRPPGGQVAIPNSPVVAVLVMSPSCPSQGCSGRADVAGKAQEGRGAACAGARGWLGHH